MSARTSAGSPLRPSCRCWSMRIPAGGQRSTSRERSRTWPAPARPAAISRTRSRPSAVVTADEMVDRIKAAVDGRPDDAFVIMARTDAHAVEGQQAAIERAQRYVDAGADMIFAEALTTLDEYRAFTTVVNAPVLGN